MSEPTHLDELFDRTVEGMGPGEEAWTVPWALSVDDSGSAWIRADYPVLASSAGTAQLRIRRTKTGCLLEHSEVDITWCQQRRWVDDPKVLPVEGYF